MSLIPDLSKPDAANLRPVIFIDEIAKEPTVAYSNESSEMQHVPLTGGFVKSLDPEHFPFDAVIEEGGDDITFLEGIPAVGHLDCNLFLRFKDDPSKRAYVNYSGIVHMGGVSGEIVGEKKSTKMSFQDGYVTCHPKFFMSKNCKAERWVDSKNFLGKGRFLRDENGVLKVQYWLYALE
ncbi:DEKNAAC103956 [Brettanomyces naardenensis]|uniref:DEKNAAC103956 n=1 Tax=Brettanomyces naardenensis TaxID=13370 RepID=A0A448YPJ9_BRENA|nr:DEKNAAC103956 [Brettanomyces naardenensis]